MLGSAEMWPGEPAASTCWRHRKEGIVLGHGDRTGDLS